MKIHAERKSAVRAQIVWVLGAAVAGFALSALLSGLLHLPRNILLVPYGVATGAFLYGYFQWCGVDLANHFRDYPFQGLLGAAFAGTLMIWNVVSQPASARPEGWTLVLALLWPGVVYGLLDALFLSVMPVVATWLACAQSGLTVRLSGRLLAGALALTASLVVTAAYHLGYSEFRGPQVGGPILGNALLTLAYLFSGSPLSTTLGHVAMHVASVLHGMETTIQLPPHY